MHTSHFKCSGLWNLTLTAYHILYTLSRVAMSQTQPYDHLNTEHWECTIKLMSHACVRVSSSFAVFHFLYYLPQKQWPTCVLYLWSISIQNLGLSYIRVPAQFLIMQNWLLFVFIRWLLWNWMDPKYGGHIDGWMNELMDAWLLFSKLVLL